MEGQSVVLEDSSLYEDEIVTLEDLESELSDGLEQEYEVPTGEGLNKSEAQALLIDEMNRIRQGKNADRLAKYRGEVKAYKLALEHNHKIDTGRLKADRLVVGQFPVMLPLINTFNSRQIQQAVFMARQRGGYDSLLEAAGYRAKK